MPINKVSFFHKLFPVPKYIAMPTVGMDISDKSIKLMFLKESGDHFDVDWFDELEIPEGTISSGVVNDEVALRKVLEKAKNKHKIEHAAISLPEEKTYLFTLSLSGVMRKDIYESIELQIEEHVPLAGDQTVFDYHVVAEKGDERQVVVFAFPKDVVMGYLRPFKSVGIQPIIAETESASLLRSIIPKGSQDSVMIVDMGRARTGVTIASSGHVRFTATLPLGGDQMDKAIVDNLNLSLEEAIAIKEEKGLSREEDKLSGALMPVAAALLEEINKHRLFWDTHKDQETSRDEKISSIFLCGGESNVPGLVDYLQSGCDARVKVANPWVNVMSFEDRIPNMPRAEALRYATSIGLALANVNGLSHE